MDSNELADFAVGANFNATKTFFEPNDLAWKADSSVSKDAGVGADCRVSYNNTEGPNFYIVAQCDVAPNYSSGVNVRFR